MDELEFKGLISSGLTGEIKYYSITEKGKLTFVEYGDTAHNNMYKKWR